ncbi:sigma-54-dependent Fis family transcriptional regulator [Halothiobacillus diazotrophicus]|uniref:Sigma-54-dependent Fis family transcriptional regulator n=1 Tax=Halothiobacillus diazotrophicus TaxID=1860122 RepID=A0A191ZHJ5_9GAMM|nr:sigma-54 dependent transcriptional regulator [Halothiobacillus diazotrophicus]ANJ67366.1 sigma-54-dependent Fis family transcriptional regulator [Halothiobacillus diazotrophicus]
MPACLIIDDEPDIRTLIALALGRDGITCHLAADLAEARQLLDAAGEELDFCLTDMRLPDGDGLDLLEEIRDTFPTLPVAVITAHGQVDAAVRALKAGAFDFVSKPIEQLVLKRLVRDALKRRAADATTEPDDTPISRTEAPVDASPLLGESRAMQALRMTIDKVARSQAPVFIHGESGTGKELVARQIHARSGRADGPFVPVNCGAIPADLIESELFGHKKGAFTGAHQSNSGLFRAAEGGTLLLDEVAELPLSLQVKLLRVIQERKVRPVGEHSEIPVDVRILSASHQDLAAAVREGRFRHDLFYRLNVIELKVPPLRDRLDDLPILCRHILDKLAAREQCAPMDITPDALSWLASLSFEGNIRELENRLERAMALSDGDRLTRKVLSDSLMTPAAHLPAQDAHLEIPGLPSLNFGQAPHNALEAEEQRMVLNALEDTRWNRSEAARQLGMTLRQLRYRLSKWGVE